MLGKRLRDIREQNKLSQNELAEKIGKSQETISSWENGRTSPKMKDLSKLCQLYDCTYQYLTGIKQTDPSDITMEDILYKITMFNEDELLKLQHQIEFLLRQKQELRKMEAEKQRLLNELNRLEEQKKSIMLTPGGGHLRE